MRGGSEHRRGLDGDEVAQRDAGGRRAVDELSGGQRQRVWLAMALAQDTPILLLDEPTTYLDISHQVDVLELCARLHDESGRTAVAVLHGLNQAARDATHLIALGPGGAVAASGPPAEVLTEELATDVYGLACRVVPDPETGTPMVVPRRPLRGPASERGPAAAPPTVPSGPTGSVPLR